MVSGAQNATSLLNQLGNSNGLSGLGGRANAAGCRNSSDANEIISSDRMKELQQQGQDYGLGSLLDGFDSLSLSPESDFSLQYARSQFEVNYQVMQKVSTANGFEMQEMSFSLKGTFEQLSLSSGASASGVSSSDAMDSVMDYFSPEKTAGRILDFALGFFPASDAYKEGGDTEESRRSFADFIGGAIQKGFDQAMGVLGAMSNVNSKIMEDVDKTHEIVFAGLENFVKNGLNQADSAEDEAAASAQAYRMQMSLQVEYRSVSYYNYDSSGNGVDAQDNSSAVDAVA